MALQSLTWLLAFVAVTSVLLYTLGYCLDILGLLLDGMECAITLFATMWTCVSALGDLALTALTTATSVLDTYNNVTYIPYVGQGVAIITTLTAGWFGCRYDWSPVTKHFNQCVARLETPFNAICNAIDRISGCMQKQSWILTHIGTLVVFLGVVWAFTFVMAMYCVIIPVVLPVYFVYRKVRLSLEQRRKADAKQIAMVKQYQEFVMQMFRDYDPSMSHIEQPLDDSTVLQALENDKFWKAQYDRVPVATPSRRASFPIIVLGLSVVIVWMYLCAVPSLDEAFAPSLDGCLKLGDGYHYACLECATLHTNQTQTFQDDDAYYTCAKNLMDPQPSGSPKLGQALCNVPSVLMVQQKLGVPLGCGSATTGTTFDTMQQLIANMRTQLQRVRIRSDLWCAFSWWLYLVGCSFVLWLGCWLIS